MKDSWKHKENKTLKPLFTPHYQKKLVPYPHSSMSLFLLQSPLLLFPSLPFSPKTVTTPLNSLLLSPHRRRGHRRPVTAIHVSDGDPIQTLAASASPNVAGASDQVPAVRSYENDLACLTLVGSVRLDQALTAAAADGGDAAEGHLANGMETMVVETVFPGTAGEHSTVSTRLFLPAKKVKERAKKLSSSFTADILSSTGSASKNILAMTFRQVVVQTLWSYKLSFFRPGTERDMEHLANPREVLAKFTVSSSDKRFLAKLADVVCSYSLESTKKFYLQNAGGLPSNIFDWFRKHQKASLVDSSICVYRLSQDEIMKNARNQVENFDLVKGEFVYRGQKLKHSLLEPPKFSQLDKFGVPGFSEWANEFFPAYRLQIDANAFKDAKLEGWQELSNNRWEVLLTHFQMVELVSILDMYYEDQYTLPDKELSCGLTTLSPLISNKKNSLWKLLFVSVAGGCVVGFVSILAQLYWPNLLKAGKLPDTKSIPLLSETYNAHLKSLDATEAEALCMSVIHKIKDELGWPGDIMFDKSFGAWIGILPSYLTDRDIILSSISSEGEQRTDCSSVDSSSHEELTSSVTAASEAGNLAVPTTAEDIASYQVVMSGDGKVVGFQPTSRVAVNHWASNPLAKILYGGRNLSPGLLEPNLKISLPSEVMLVELLMSVNPESQFALARPLR